MLLFGDGCWGLKGPVILKIGVLLQKMSASVCVVVENGIGALCTVSIRVCVEGREREKW